MTDEVPAGLDVRPLTQDDLAAAAQLVVDCDLDASGFSEFTVDDLRSMTRLDRFDAATDSWFLRDRDEPVALGLVWDSKPNEIFHSFGVVRKPHQGRGIGSFILASAERRASERGRPGAVLRTYVDINEPQAVRLAKEQGFRFIRRHWSMLVEFGSAPPPPSPVPGGVAIRSGSDSEEDARLLHALVNETFAGHWNFVPKTYEQFRRVFLDRDDTDPGMWLFAHAGGEPAGMLLGQRSERFGWVQYLGVRAAYRRRGIGEALLRTAFRAFHERGFGGVALDVDAGNETGALRLYERAGMTAKRGDDEYEKRLST